MINNNRFFIRIKFIMNNSNIQELNFEDVLLIIFIIISLLNIYGNYNSKLYLNSNNKEYKRNANQIFKFTLTITLIIYFYFLNRNYKAYKNAPIKEKNIYKVKVFGSIFLIVGIICLLYFQETETSFINTPAI